MRHIALLGLALSATWAAGPAAAEDWVVTVGVRPEAVIPYEGANHDIFFPTPVLQIRRADHVARPIVPDDTPGWPLIYTDHLMAGPVLRFREKRSSDGDYAGLHEVPWAIEPGLFATLWPTEWLRGHVEVRRGVKGHSGWEVDGALDLAAYQGPWSATVGPRIGWGDHDYMRHYFGVTAQDAATSPLVNVAYSPSAGVRYGGVGATLSRNFGPHWSAGANFSYRRLAGPAGDSPIIHTIGGRDELSGGASLRYSFDWSH
jgi:outer membrane protein